MSVQAQEESPVAWDVEGWVKAALRNWADGYDEIEVHGHRAEGGEHWIELTVHDRPLATIFVVRT